MTEITPWGDDSAGLYELVFAREDHDAQVASVHEIVRREAPDAVSLLDVACGTGWHLERLGRWFEVEGLDGSRGMLAHARAVIFDDRGALDRVSTSRLV